MNVSLICEGPCNPSLRTVDEAVRREFHLDGRIVLSDQTVAALRQLRHTDHKIVGSAQARCLECSQLRQYGN